MTAEHIADLACYALVKEVDVTPKPGLVDKNNNGAHNDMCREMFLKSAETLKPFFEQMCTAPICDLREIGIAAENEMYSVTGGVNTHKGAIFSLGILSKSAYMCNCTDVDFICEKAKEIANELLSNVSFADSNGERVLREYNVSGARGEALSGFKSVRKYALPKLEKFLETDTEEASLVKTLLVLMSIVDDSNVYHRGGKKGAEYVKSTSRSLLNDYSNDGVIIFDNELIKRNISPGGCADLLAVTVFLYNIKIGG